MLKLSGGITKHLCDGHSPYYLVQESDLSAEEWTTFKSEELKKQYNDNICPICGNLHLMQGSGEVLYGHCNTALGLVGDNINTLQKMIEYLNT